MATVEIKFFKDRLSRIGDGDTIDRLSASFTAGILLLASTVIAGKQYFGEPIKCWVPAEFPKAWQEYTEGYCYVQEKYFGTSKTPFEQKGMAGNTSINYYQWVPLILILQATLFYLPRIIWRLLYRFSGISLNSVLQPMKTPCDKDHNQHLAAVIDHVKWLLDLSRKSSRRSYWSHWFSRINNYYLIIAFALIKIIYIGNAVGQILFLDKFLGTQDPLFGVSFVRSWINGTTWLESGYFPRTILCDFKVYLMGNIHQYSIQCVIPANVFNEKLFMFLWFWIAFVAIMSVIGFAYWIFCTLLPGIRRRFVRHLLRDLPTNKQHPLTDCLPKFVDEELGMDGVFLLRIISNRVGTVIASKISTALWEDFNSRCYS